MPTKTFFRYICDLPVQSDGAAPDSLTEQKNRNLRMLPADGTIAARVAHWEFGISRRQLKLTYILQGPSKRPDNRCKSVTGAGTNA